MARYQAGDPSAATELVRELSPRILRFLAEPWLTRFYAEDLLQECWLRIHQARRTYRPGAPVLPWIFAIARNTRCDGYRHLRSAGAFRKSPLNPERNPVSLATPENSQVDLALLIARLPEAQREVIVMLKVSGMSLQEVAGATGTTVGAVKQKAHRAYQKLRSLLNTNHDGAP